MFRTFRYGVFCQAKDPLVVVAVIQTVLVSGPLPFSNLFATLWLPSSRQRRTRGSSLDETRFWGLGADVVWRLPSKLTKKVRAAAMSKEGAVISRHDASS